MSENLRIEPGWIFVDGTRQDDGTIEFGTGGEMRLSPFEAMSQRRDTQITWGTFSRRRCSAWLSGAARRTKCGQHRDVAKL